MLCLQIGSLTELSGQIKLLGSTSCLQQIGGQNLLAVSPCCSFRVEELLVIFFKLLVELHQGIELN